MNIDEDTSPSTAFHALLTRKERESLPTPQGEKEKAVRSQLCTRSALLEAQPYDTINAYTKLFIMNDAGIPADLRKKLNTELEQFNSQITQTLMDKSTDCVRRNTTAEQMGEEPLAVFNKAAKKHLHWRNWQNRSLIDRYGGSRGDFAAPQGTPYGMRSLPYSKNSRVYHVYQVLRPIEDVEIGEIAPAFNQPGGGIQYHLPASIKQLLEEGYIKEVK